MKSIYFSNIRPALFLCILTVSLPGLAMSENPEHEPVSLEAASTNKYGTLYKDRNPEVDARTALDKGNLHLLGFALRATVVPGVALADRQAAIEACGVQLIKGFGDVMRSDEQANAMQKAHKYAERYNAVVLKQCFEDN